MEYAKKFLELELFTLGVVSSESARVDEFFWGLKAKLKDKITTTPRNTSTEMIDAATTLEIVMGYDQFMEAIKNPIPTKTKCPN